MGGDVWGGGVMVAVAATLWVVYLIPTWRRRREYATAERNAVRLQQTLRVLAETSEMPEQVRLGANARGAIDRQRAVRQVRDTKREASGGVAAAGRLSVRRLRLASSALLLLAMVGIIVGLVLPAVAGKWLVFVIAIASGSVALVSLKRLARRQAPVRVVPLEATLVPDFAFESAAAPHGVEIPRATWTPRPVPKPLYQSRGSVASSAMASADASAQRRHAAATAEAERRASESESKAVPLRASASGDPRNGASSVETGAVPSRLAAMGVVVDAGGDGFDLDEVLRRRRAG